MKDKVRAACVQMTSGVEIAGNIEQSTALIRAAHADGAPWKRRGSRKTSRR
jgi:predicted amidohydrolase